MKGSFFIVFVLIFSLVLLSGCMSEIVIPESGSNSVITDIHFTSQDSPSGGTVKGNLKIYLTDSSPVFKDPPDFVSGPPEGNGPPNFDEQYLEVNISISIIEGHIAEDEEGEDGSWERLKEWNSGYDVDLMDLENVSVLLASLNLEPNIYTQLRIFLAEDAELVLLRDGYEVTKTLKIPSSAQTGIKLNHPFEIVAGSVTKLTLDFDANKSVVKLGNGEYLMKPVIGVSSETYPSEDVPEGAGVVSGSVSYYNSNSEDPQEDPQLVGIGGAKVELTGGTYVFANTVTTSIDGTFSLTDVPAGSYTLNVYADGYDAYSEAIEVAADTEMLFEVVFLIEEPGAIIGTVVDEVNNDPVEGATVTATLSGSNYDFTSSTETINDGTFFLGMLPVGSYNLTITAEGYAIYEDTGIVVNKDTTNDLGVIELN